VAKADKPIDPVTPKVTLVAEGGSAKGTAVNGVCTCEPPAAAKVLVAEASTSSSTIADAGAAKATIAGELLSKAGVTSSTETLSSLTSAKECLLAGVGSLIEAASTVTDTLSALN